MTEESRDEPTLPWWIVGLAVVIGVVMRFSATSPLWLDEALSVNIAEAANSETSLSDLLRRDGHPPLYYWLLGWWTDVFGTGDRGVRSLSGVLSVVTLGFAYLVGRLRYSETTARILVVVLALSPFAVRYANETRMYALATLLAFVGWWAIERARRQPTVERLALVAVTAAALLYTHYWAIWLLGAVGILLLVAASGRFGSWNSTAARRVAAAILLGGMAFVPWLGVLLDQAANTGTPWASPARPTSDIVGLLFDLGGGKRSEAQLLAMIFVVLGTVAALLSIRRVEGEPPELTTGGLHHDARTPLAVLLGTLVTGLAVGGLSGSVFVPRYASVILPALLMLVALGIGRLLDYRLRAGLVMLAVVAAAGTLMSAVELATDRSQGEEVAVFLNESADKNDTIIYCPDQLGPAANRYLAARFPFQEVYPSGARPELVDWRDYQAKLDSSDVVAFASDVRQRFAGNTIWYVVATNYTTHNGACEALISQFSQPVDGQGIDVEIVVRGDGQLVEAMNLYRFSPAK